MTKKTIEQIESLLRTEIRILENSLNEDLKRNSYNLRLISERLKIVERQDTIQSISIILAKCDFCWNDKNRYQCLKHMPCSTCIYNFLVKRLHEIADEMNNEKKGSGNT